MAKYTNDELLEAFGEMTLVELSEFVKAFEEKFDVEAAAPVAVCCRCCCRRCRRRGREERVRRHPLRRWRQEDPGHQGCPGHHHPGLADAKALVDGAPKAVLERPRRKTPRRPSLSWKKLAPPSSSSDSRGFKPLVTAFRETPYLVPGGGVSPLMGESC